MKSFRIRPSWLAVGLIPLFALAGCASTPDTATSAPEPPQSDPTPTITVSPSPSDTPTQEQEPEPEPEQPTADTDWSKDPQISESIPGTQSGFVTDFRVASHEGFDRVVVEFSGDALPGWVTGWTDAAFSQGKGDPIEVTGPALLDVTLTGTSFPQNDEETALYFAGASSVSAGEIRAVFDSAFEDQTHLVIGMDQQRPYRVSTLTDPVRVVIDVQTP